MYCEKISHHYVILEKGFKGEKNFNRLAGQLSNEVLFLTTY